ncbi:hypothetical protein ACFQE1_04025 [Halobium palmae]|uniref:Uncharacterized protein n=1 Tax=Halobium palmae TaxID=1776492 RepID=A0ABD5RVU5_9EURY
MVDSPSGFSDRVARCYKERTVPERSVVNFSSFPTAAIVALLTAAVLVGIGIFAGDPVATAVTSDLEPTVNGVSGE